ncbi:MAG: hypothetical protein J2P47_12090 [Acetobacteraceae bacterium]|nr:hypothetical protein [Acetobacteraceae bacterium]
MGAPFIALTIAVPFLGAALQLAAPPVRLAGSLGISSALATFLLTLCLVRGSGGGPLLSGDALGVHFAILTSFVALTTAWLRPERVPRAHDVAPADLRRGRFSEAARHCLVGGTLLSLLAREPALSWTGAEIACGAACGLFALGPTDGGRQAARRLALGHALGLALALFGTVLLTLAVAPGPGSGGWEALRSAAPHAERGTLTIGACFLVVGYGIVATLVPPCAWLADSAADEQPLAAALVLCVLPNVGLVAILRLRAVMAANATAISLGPPLIALGLASLLLSAGGLWGRREGAGLLIAPTTAAVIGGRGVAALAFGLGGAGAALAGLMQMTLLTLSGVAVLQCLSLCAPRAGSGLLQTDERVGLSLLAGVFGLTGLPPLGVFASVFLIAVATAREAWLLALPLAVGLAALGGALLMDAGAIVRDEPSPPVRTRVPLSVLAPIWLELAITLVLSLAMPHAVADWLRAL